METTRTPRATLCEHDAWEIATTWLAPLRGKVRLVVDRDGAAQSIVDRYAWVRVDPPDTGHPWLTASIDPLQEGKERASIVRAAMLVWFALSRCLGFAGHENPVFWKRVFSEFYSDRSVMCARERIAPSVSDAVTFFDQLECAFPRYMIQVNDLFYSEPSRVDARTVLGLAGHGDLSPRIAAAVESILHKLEPFMIGSENQLTVDVYVTVDAFLMNASSTSPYARVAAFLEDVNRSSPSHSTLPQFRIVQFQEDGAIDMGSTMHQESFDELVRTVSVRLGHFALYQPMLDLSVEERATWVTNLLRLDGVQAQVNSLRFMRHAIDDEMFAALFSALPFARSVELISFDAFSISRNGTFDLRDVPWIAYALFHPQARASSWRQLALQHAILTEETAFALKAMARGNNLLALLNGTTPLSNAYYSVELRDGTTVRHEPSAVSDPVFQVTSTIRVDVCGVSSPDTSTWGEWVAIVRPAYGLGWVRSSQVQQVRADPPSKSTLTGLGLRSGHSQQDLGDSLAPFLSVLGTSLTYLDIGAYTEVDSTTIADILRACPALKVFVARHSGAFWSDPCVNVPADCPLEELELIVPGDIAAVSAPACEVVNSILCRLRALRITAHKAGVLQASQPAIERILTRATPLRHFHWRNARRALKQFDPYDSSRAQTQELLAELELSKLLDQYARRASPSSMGIAFLSVVRTAQVKCDLTETDGSLSALARLTDPVLNMIFQFARNPPSPVICIDPDNKEPPDHVEVTWWKWIHDGLKCIFGVPEVQ